MRPRVACVALILAAAGVAQATFLPGKNITTALAALNTTKDALLAQIELKEAVDVFVDPGLR